MHWLLHRLIKWHLLLHGLLHHLLLTHAGSEKFTSQLDFTSMLAFVLEIEPLNNSSWNVKCARLHNCIGDGFTFEGVFVQDSEMDIISYILNLNLEDLIPDRVLACILLNSGFHNLISVSYSAEWVHFAEKFGVTS